MDRKYKDPIFAVFYALSFLAFVLSGFIILFMTDVSKKYTVIYQKKIKFV